MYSGRTILKCVLAFVTAALTLLGVASTATAQDSGPSIFGSLDYEDPELEEDIPAVGVVLTVTGADGFEATGTTDDASGYGPGEVAADRQLGDEHPEDEADRLDAQVKEHAPHSLHHT